MSKLMWRHTYRIIVQPDELPRFWIFVYQVSPLIYFIRGLVAAGLANTHIHCSAIETFLIEIPVDQSGIASNMTCASYFAPYMEVAGGYLDNPEATNGCRLSYF
jgi:ATP-binding cassette, subfamily G (WHITE), member 2, PDR